ncbi:hypothetical protein BK786_22555 [Bacillus thuringiensis serovar thailandensis]|nr:hypothetical protein BK786_22555 [Bacillus thuringiensis serovar thailandensis]
MGSNQEGNAKKSNDNGYTLKYLVKGKMQRKQIKTNDFLEANEQAVGILKNEKKLVGNCNKNMNIILESNRDSNVVYQLKWNKHPILSGPGGYFSKFEQKVDKEDGNKKKKWYSVAEDSFVAMYGLPLSFLFLGIIVFFGLYILKRDFPEAKLIWLVGTLIYSALLPVGRAILNKMVKSNRGILWNNIVLDTPLWLGAIMSLIALFQSMPEVANYWKCLTVLMVIFFFGFKILLNYWNEKFKFYDSKVLK